MDSEIRKNTYELLSMSDSDSDSCQQMLELNYKSPRRKRLRKRLPSYRMRRFNNIENQKCCQSYGKLLSLSFIIIILCCWLLVLSWLVVIFNDELKRFDTNIMAIVVGNQGIPESLQKCHSQTKQLKKNQSELNILIVGLNAKLLNLSKEVSSIANELTAVRDKLGNSSPSLINVPINLKEVSDNVLTVKNWIEHLNDTVSKLTISENRLREDFHTFKLNATNCNKRLLPEEKVPRHQGFPEFPENRIDIQKLLLLINKLSDNVTYLNNSLTSEIQLVKENQLREHNITEDLKIQLNQNISFKLNMLHDKYNEFSFISDTVNNLTYQIGLSNQKLNLLSNEMNNLRNTSNFYRTNASSIVPAM